MKNIRKEIEVNYRLLEDITPFPELEVKTNKIVIGENIAKIYTVLKYPPYVSLGWLSKITNIAGTVTCQTIEPTDNSSLIEAMSKSVALNNGIAEGTKDVLTKQRALREIKDAEKLIQRIDQEGETVCYMTVLIMVMAKDEEMLDKRCKRVESIISGLKCKVRAMGYLTKESFYSIAPFGSIDKLISKIAKRNVPLSTVTGGFPFASSGLNDGKGYYFGKDANGGIVVLDTWKREGDRTNTNFVIMGIPGVGKSTVTKHIILNEFMKNTKIIIIDPEREYQELCRNLKGNWINAGGGIGGRINPLQIRPAPRDVENEKEMLYKDEGKGMSDMALHFQTLRTFFTLTFPELTGVQIALLEVVLEELYKKFNITWNTAIERLTNKDFPVFKDLYNLLLEKLDKEQNDLVKKDYKIILSFIRQISIGAESSLWNGETNIRTNTKCVVLDTFSLQNASIQVKKAQYFNLLNWCWEQMSKNREEKALLICDEAYLLIDPQIPQSLIFLRNVAKRARKYESGIAIISHSVVDFLDPSIKLYGQALLDNPTYKILMGCDGKNLKETQELYNLNNAESDLLYSRRRGQALFIAGTGKTNINFQLFPYEFNYFGSSGGR